MVKVRVQKGDVAAVEADLLVVNLFKGVKQPGGATGAVDRALGGAVARLVASGDFTGAFKETALLYPEGAAAKRVMIVGLGDAGKLTLDRVRQIGARVAKRARDLGVRRAHTILHGGGIGGLDAEASARAVAEGAVLGLYAFERYKTKTPKKKGEPEKRLDELVIVEHDAAKARDATRGVARGVAVAESVNLARGWATLSGAEALAPALAKEAQAMAREVGLACRVLDGRRIRELKMGGILAVNAASAHEPRLVVLEHGKAHKRKGTVVLVGKGVTFDSGGLSIKPAEKMDEMKFDKAGAAAVWGALRAAALLDLPVHVVGITPLVENVIGAEAIKPGDVYRAHDGKTVEVLNTDAEGRLILADAIAYAAEFEPDAVVDIATLTGHIVVAFGWLCSGMTSNDAALAQRVKAAAEAAHEPVFELPFFEEYGELVKGKVADVRNHAGRPAGAITAAKFLEAFVPEGVAWAHLDVAGTAWHMGGSPAFNEEYSPGQATGVGVRTFVHLLETWEGPLRSRPASTRRR